MNESVGEPSDIGGSTLQLMYMAEIESRTAWTDEVAELVTHRSARFTSRIMFTCNGFTVHAPVLPVSWQDLGVSAGSTVLVTAEGGRLGAAEDAGAVADVADYLATIA